MPTVVLEREIEPPDELPVICERLFKVTTPDGTEETYTPDEACDLKISLSQVRWPAVWGVTTLSRQQ